MNEDHFLKHDWAKILGVTWLMSLAKEWDVQHKAQRACHFPEDSDCRFLDDRSIAHGRGYTKGLVRDGKRELGGDPTCVHYLIVTHIIANDKALQEALKKAGIPEEVSWFIAYFHDHGEDFCRDEIARDPKLIVERFWKGDPRYNDFIADILYELTDPSDLHGERRLRYQATVANGKKETEEKRELTEEEKKLEEIKLLLITKIRAADKIATGQKDLELFNKYKKHFLFYYLLGRLDEKKLVKSKKRIRLRYDCVINDMDRLSEEEKASFLDLSNSIIAAADELLARRKKFAPIVNAPSRAVNKVLSGAWKVASILTKRAEPFRKSCQKTLRKNPHRSSSDPKH